jgi:hypothetical protein
MFIKCFFTIVLHQPGNEINIEKSRKNDKFSVKQNIPIFQRFRLRVSNQLINPPSGLVQIIHKNKVMTWQFEYVYSLYLQMKYMFLSNENIAWNI